MLNYRRYAITVSKIRKRFIEKSNAVKAVDALYKDEEPLTSQKKSRIYSTRSRSTDGLSEYERQRLERKDQFPTRKYKKRCLKQLSVAERRDIMHAHLVEY